MLECCQVSLGFQHPGQFPKGTRIQSPLTSAWSCVGTTYQAPSGIRNGPRSTQSTDGLPRLLKPAVRYDCLEDLQGLPQRLSSKCALHSFLSIRYLDPAINVRACRESARLDQGLPMYRVLLRCKLLRYHPGPQQLMNASHRASTPYEYMASRPMETPGSPIPSITKSMIVVGSYCRAHQQPTKQMLLVAEGSNPGLDTNSTSA